MLNVADSAPDIFPSGAPGVPANQAAVINENGTFNGPALPAPKGSVILIYATGEGQTNPAGVSGKRSVAPYPQPAAEVAAQVGGRAADVLFAVEAPGQAGVLRIDVVIPTLAGSGAVPVALSVAGVFSPVVTVFVK